MSIMCSIAMLAVLTMPSLIANSLASEAVVLLAGALKNNIYWPKLQICIAETAYIYLEGITLASVTTTRLKEEKEALKQR